MQLMYACILQENASTEVFFSWFISRNKMKTNVYENILHCMYFRKKYYPKLKSLKLFSFLHSLQTLKNIKIAKVITNVLSF
jgi:hypothetical protein